LSPSAPRIIASLAAGALAAIGLSACGSHASSTTVSAVQSTTTTSATVTLPGTGHPPVTIGDKNFTEQFVLGELYRQALAAQGFNVSLTRNIGPTAVSIQAIQSGRLDLYPEYLQAWNTDVAADPRQYPSARAAYDGAQRYAQAHGMALLDPTAFSHTDAIAVTEAYAAQNGLHTIADLAKVAPKLMLGGPPQFKQIPTGLPAIEQGYNVILAGFIPLALGDQYQALDQGAIQAADVITTDGQLDAGEYVLLGDPKNIFGWGNVIPVVSGKVLAAEGPVFSQTINRVDAMLTPQVMRQLDASVDVAHQDPADVAKRFLLDTGLIPTLVPGS
jgi:osmoprotectant transport system substrate-binding protein